MADATLKMILLGQDRGASKALKHVGDAANQTEKHTHRLGSAFAKAGKIAAVGLFAGLAGGVIVAKKFASAAIEDQQSAALMARQFKNSAGATKEQVAATESWITKQGIAKGVADDQLRPALSRLVTATHDVGKAQKLTSLAMDVSAGTGKSLSSVSLALMKAYNGNVGGLSRLGIATKDASGKTKSFTQVSQDMARQFGGAATTKANTLAGKMGRLKLIMSETGEAIGYKLIPVLTKVGTWFLNVGVPAVMKFFHQMKTGQGVGGQVASVLGKVKTVLVALGIAALATARFLTRHKTATMALVTAMTALYVITKVHTAFVAVQAAGGLLKYLRATKLITAATKVWAAVQWLMNAALTANPIGVVIAVIAALVVGIIYAYKHSSKFRSIVQGAFRAVAAAGSFMWNNVLKPTFKFLTQAWLTVAGAIVNGAAHAFGWVPGLGNKLKAAAAWFNNFKDNVNRTLNGVKDRNVKVKADVYGAGAVDNLALRISRVRGKTVQITANTRTTGGGAYGVTARAVGGSVMAGHAYRVGERGPETLIANTSGRMMTAAESQRMGSGGSRGGNDFHGTIEVDLKQDGRTMQKVLLQLKRQNGNVLLGLA